MFSFLLWERKRIQLYQLRELAIFLLPPLHLMEEIEKWEIYRDFTEHAVMEVSNGELDEWLEEE